MSNEYRECVLGDIGKISMCKRILKNQTSESGEIPFYKIASFGGIADCFISKELFEEYKNKYSYPNKGDILISAAGTLGRTVIFDGKPSYFQDSNIVWIDNDETKVCNNYLYYFYQTKPWIKTSGSTIDRLYNDNIRNIKIKYPMDINEQKKIINPLKLIDDKIETNNKINTELEAMAKTIYDYWFLQFEFPNEEGKPYKSSGGKMVWNEELKREIPEGWECKKISELCSFSNGINYDKNEIGDKNYKIINVRNITSSSILLDSNDLDEIISLPEETIDLLKQQAETIDTNNLIRVLNILSEAQDGMKVSSNPRVLMEVTMMKIAQPMFDDSKEALLKRIENLEQKIESGNIKVNHISTNQTVDNSNKNEKVGNNTLETSHEEDVEYENLKSDDVKLIQKSWKNILQKMKEDRQQITRALLQDVDSFNIADDILYIIFTDNYSFAKNKLDSPQTIQYVEKVIREVLNRNFNVKIVFKSQLLNLNTEIKKEDKGEQILKDIVSEDILEVKDSIEKS